MDDGKIKYLFRLYFSNLVPMLWFWTGMSKTDNYNLDVFYTADNIFGTDFLYHSCYSNALTEIQIYI